MHFEKTRRELTSTLLARTQDILGNKSPTRTQLAEIKVALNVLADKNELWTGDDFPPPNAEEKQNRFLIAQDNQHGYSLYLNVMRPGKVIEPHNHTVWACISAVEGAELNTIYDRVDDGSVEGKAELKIKEVVELKPGNSLAMLADDIHSVEIRGSEVIRHLHFYGQPIETLTSRTEYDLENDTCRVKSLGVQTKS